MRAEPTPSSRLVANPRGALLADRDLGVLYGRRMARRWLRGIADRLLQRGYAIYTARERRVRFEGLALTIPPGVFPPLFASSRVLVRVARERARPGARALDVGAGSGVAAIAMARAGATVTAVDRNGLAVRAVRENAKRAGVAVEAIESDLFTALEGRVFDLVVANPPFFAVRAHDVASHAWFAGPELDYFERFFRTIETVRAPAGRVFLVLSDRCDLDRIHALAEAQGLVLVELERWRSIGEWTLVFELGRVPNGDGPRMSGA